LRACSVRLLRSAWSVGALCAVAPPLTMVSEARWENCVTALRRPLASETDRTETGDYIHTHTHTQTRMPCAHTRWLHTVHISKVDHVTLLHLVQRTQGDLSSVHQVIWRAGAAYVYGVVQFGRPVLCLQPPPRHTGADRTVPLAASWSAHPHEMPGVTHTHTPERLQVNTPICACSYVCTETHMHAQLFHTHTAHTRCCSCCLRLAISLDVLSLSCSRELRWSCACCLKEVSSASFSHTEHSSPSLSVWRPIRALFI
jgi:hypothetical protein